MLERDGRTRLFTVWSFAGKEDLDRLPKEVALWRAPGLVRTRGTTLGALDVVTLLPDDPRMTLRDGRFQPLPRAAWRPRRVDEEFDALLYLGPIVTSVAISRELCDDAAYVEMRTRRMALTPRGQADIARLKKQCGK